MLLKNFFVRKGDLDKSGLGYLHVLINGIERRLLLDIGASVSILKSYCLKNEVVDDAWRMQISGVFGSMRSRGKAPVTLLLEDESFMHPFTVLDHLQTRVEGILGVDFFLANRACIDYNTKVFQFYNNNKLIKVKLEENPYVNSFTIPARCGMIFYCKTKELEECVVTKNCVKEF